MSKYYLMKLSLVPAQMGATKLESFIKSHLGIAYNDLSSHFGTNDLVTSKMVSDLNQDGLKTVDVIMNPFNRIFVEYLTNVFMSAPTVGEINDCVSPPAFQDYVKALYGDDSSTRKKMNHCEVRPAVDYLIRVENYEQDLKKIPELATANTKGILSDMEFLYNNMYRAYYDDESKALITSVFNSDFTKYGYAF